MNLLIVHCLSVEQINRFGWRIPFVLGGLLCFVGYLIRRELHETVEFKKIKQHTAAPFIEVLKNHFGNVMIGVGLVSIMATPIILLIIFMPAYLTKLAHIPAKIASDAVLTASIVSVASIYIMGILANKYNVYKLMRNSLILILPAAAICYYLISQKSNLILALTLFAVFQGFLVVLPTIVLSYLFPVNIRLTGVALSYNISFVFFGGLTPIIITSIIAETTGLVFIIPFVILLVTVLFAYWALRQSQKYLPE